ncbi:MAG: AAA family ATPase [Alphaproteobacteria bacterium]|nr:AAA family ATPase [Alphaproteobacteria bacterium]
MVQSLKRVFIIGTSGCGKTTLAKKLSKKLTLEHLDTDDCYWLPEWKPRPEKEYKNILEDFTKKDQWIISGNSSDINSPIWLRCDTVIWLDYSIFRCLYQSICRSIKRIRSSEVCCGGNRETMKLFFSRKSIILWVLGSFFRRKSIYSEIFSSQESSSKLYLRITNPQLTGLWLKFVKAS